MVAAEASAAQHAQVVESAELGALADALTADPPSLPLPGHDPPFNLIEFEQGAMAVKFREIAKERLADKRKKDSEADPPTDDKCGDTTLLFGPVCSLEPPLEQMLAADVYEESQSKRAKKNGTPLVGGGADDQKIGLLKHILNNARAAAGDAAVAKFSGLWSAYFNDVELGDDEFPREFHSDLEIVKKSLTVGSPSSVWMGGDETRATTAEYMNVKTMPSVALLEDTEANAENRARALKVANNILREEGKATLAYMKLYFPGSSLFRNEYAVTEDRKTVARYIWALTFICLNPDKVTAAPAVTDRKILIDASPWRPTITRHPSRSLFSFIKSINKSANSSN